MNNAQQTAHTGRESSMQRTAENEEHSREEMNTALTNR
jgi:hypothetical protein